jgi:hypothetical protein
VAVALVLAGAAGASGAWWLRGRRAAAPPAPAAATGVTAEDRDRDGRPDRWVERDARGAITLVREDQNRDGRPDRMSVYVSGRPNRVDYDSDLDGRFDAHRRGRRRRAGALHPLRPPTGTPSPSGGCSSTRGGGRPGSGSTPTRTRSPERYRAFDAAGRVTEEGVDANGDGLYEVNRIFNQRWPAGSPPVRIERDDDRDGIFERRETYTRAGVLKAVQRRQRRRRHPRPDDPLRRGGRGSSRTARTRTATGTSSSGDTPRPTARCASPTTTTATRTRTTGIGPEPQRAGAPCGA